MATSLLFAVEVVTASPANAFEPGTAPIAVEAEKAGPADQRVPIQSWPEEIVVTAPRGEALVKPETEMNDQDIRRYGASSIGELVRDLAPLIGGSDDGPILLVNGKRMGDASAIIGFPPEALERLAILPPAAATLYGYPAQSRVVNLVLKQHFYSWNVDAELTMPTALGRDSEQVSIGRFAVDGPTYWNAQLRLSRETALLRSSRGLPSRAETITQRHPLQVLNDFETLLPSSRGAAFNVGVNRPFGSFSGSLNFNASTSRSLQILGSIRWPFVPLDDPAWLQLANTVAIRRQELRRPLRNSQHSGMVNLSGTLSGVIGGWNTNLSASYARGWTDGLIERGAEVPTIQDVHGTNAMILNHYVSWPRSVLQVERTRSGNESWNAQLNMNTLIANFPAGPVSGNFSIGGNKSRSWNVRNDSSSGFSTRSDANQSLLNAQISLNFPLVSRNHGSFRALGEISANLSRSTFIASGSKPQSQFSAGINWSPIPNLDLRGSFVSTEIRPTIELLNAPTIEVVTRVYDYYRQEIAEPLRITGGTPGLSVGSQQAVSFRGMLRPFNNRQITLTVEYIRQQTKGGYLPFPDLTPATEMAFPERIFRDAQGRLIRIDARAINIDHDLNTRLNTGLTLILSEKAKDGALSPSSGQISISLNHNWQLKSELVVAPGLPVIDRLNGDGAQSRHALSLDILAGKPGLGINLNGRWKSEVRVRQSGASGDQEFFRYAPMAQLDLGFFVEPENLQVGGDAPPWIAKLRFSLDIQNLFKSYQRVKINDGRIPPGYSRNEIDPLGRTIRLAIRKQF